MRLVGREEILGLAATAAARSEAFLEDGEARLLVSLDPTWVSSAGSRRALAVKELLRLLTIYAKRAHVDEWFVAPGHSPESLGIRAALAGSGRGLMERVELATPDESAVVLLALHGLLPGAPERVEVQVPLALAVTPQELPQLLDALVAKGGPALQLWLADRALELRCSVRRSGIAFRAAHPLVHAGLVQRCAKDGIDLA